MPEYTVMAVASVVVVVAYELFWLRSGILSDSRFWIAMGICFIFMIPVDGWLTKLSAPIVLYAPSHHTGVRIPWDIPVEDYLFGFSLITAVLARWKSRDPAGSTASANR